MKKYILLITLILPMFVQASEYNWMWVRAVDPLEKKLVMFMGEMTKNDISALTKGKEYIFFIELNKPTTYDPQRGLVSVGNAPAAMLQIHGSNMNLRSVDILSYGAVSAEAEKELIKYYKK